MTIALAFLMLISMMVMPAAAADLDENVVLWLDFEGETLEEKLADKASGGKVADNATVDGELVRLENGTVYIPSTTYNIVRIPVSEDTAEFNNMSVYCRVKITGSAIKYGGDIYEIPKHLRIPADNGSIEGLTSFTTRLMGNSKTNYKLSGFFYMDTTAWMHIVQTISYADGLASSTTFISTDGLNYMEFSGVHTGEFTAATGDITLGKTSGANKEDRGMNMEIDDFRIYNKILNAEEVAQLAELTAPAKGAAPVETTAAPVETTAAPVETTAAPVETTAAPVVTTAAPAQTPSTADSSALFILFGAAALLTVWSGCLISRRRMD